MLTFNEALTKLAERFILYHALQKYLVPIEVGMVALLLSPFPLKIVTYTNGFMVNATFLEMTWNCLGWQSLLLFFITLLAGLRDSRYTIGSVLEVFLIGLLGTFLINLSRLSVIVLIFAYLRPIYGYIYHDYLAAFLTIIWLFGFWWFAYRYVLEEKGT